MMCEVIVNSYKHIELMEAGWITYKQENNIAYMYNPHKISL